MRSVFFALHGFGRTIFLGLDCDLPLLADANARKRMRGSAPPDAVAKKLPLNARSSVRAAGPLVPLLSGALCESKRGHRSAWKGRCELVTGFDLIGMATRQRTPLFCLCDFTVGGFRAVSSGFGIWGTPW